MLAIEDDKTKKKKGGSSSSSSSGSSSSSSSSGKKDKKKKSKKSKKDKKKKSKKSKKDKKGKKDKKDKKRKGGDDDASQETPAERRERLAAEKADMKKGLFEVKAAETLLSKLQSPLVNARALMSHALYSSVAPSIKGPLDDVCAKLAGIQADATAVVSAGGGRLEHDVKSVTIDLATLRTTMALATNMLALMERGARR